MPITEIRRRLRKRREFGATQMKMSSIQAEEHPWNLGPRDLSVTMAVMGQPPAEKPVDAEKADKGRPILPDLCCGQEWK